MNRTLLVARREYRAITSTRGFWVMLLIIPIAIAASQLITRIIRPTTTISYVIADGGRYTPAIDHRVELIHQRQVLGDLSEYAQRWNLGSLSPGAVWASGRRLFSDADIEAFINAGGAETALRSISPGLPRNAPAFKLAAPAFIRVPAPPELPTDRGLEAFAAAAPAVLQRDVQSRGGQEAVALAVYIPENFGTESPVRIWTNGRPNETLIEIIRGELNSVLRARAIEASGIPIQTFAQISRINTPVVVTAPPQGRGREQMMTRSLVPIALVYLLLITEVVTGSMLLQGVLEEKSNKLLESILACIHPRELMHGKLIGLGAVGLTIILVWVGCAVGAAFAIQGLVADFLRPSLAALDQPWMIAAMLFYFMAGYIIVSMIYLAIGSLSSSLQDAQAYLTPVILLTMLPTVMLMVSVLQDPHSMIAQVMSWVPLYTPFAMLARLGSGVSFIEVLATSAMLLVFMWLEVVLLGGVFRASLLQTGQPPKLAAYLRSILNRDGAQKADS